MVDRLLPEIGGDAVTIEVLDAQGASIRTFTGTAADADAKPAAAADEGGEEGVRPSDTKAAATPRLNAAYIGDMSAIQVVLNRLEGGVLTDEDLLDFSESMPI